MMTILYLFLFLGPSQQSSSTFDPLPVDNSPFSKSMN